IANMIANCLGVGKTVLFVAEKTAALDVVYRRLREHGLGNHCIELHSNKADRRRFLTQLKASWEHGGKADASQWITVNERLRLRRDELNAYVEALHKRYPNGWTPYLALGTALNSNDQVAPTFSWQSSDGHDAQTLLDLEELAAQVGRVFASVERQPALDLINVEEWSSDWQLRLLAAATSLHSAIGQLTASIRDYQSSLGLSPNETFSHTELQSLTGLAQVLAQTRNRDISIAYDRDFSTFGEALAKLERAIGGYRESERSLSAAYDVATVRDLDLDIL
ncbi:MAG: DNA helicase, partial [Mesorhizobium sp.]